jgi:hypothetical protein
MEVKDCVISPIITSDGLNIIRENIKKVDLNSVVEGSIEKETNITIAALEKNALQKKYDEMPRSEWTFENQHGFAPLRAVGAYIAVQIYTPIKSDVLIMADSVKAMQKWTSNVGRIFSIGSACYKGDRFKDWDELPEIGDWVVFKVNAGPVFKYRGIDVAIMFDDSVNGITEDPSYVSRD